MHRYKAWNGAMPTTAPVAAQSTGTTTKTQLQLAMPTNRQMQLIAWGYTLDAIEATGQTGVIELIQANQAATVTAHVAAGIQPLDPNCPASLLLLGTAASGYNASAEGTAPTSVRVFDTDTISNQGSVGASDAMYDYQWMPDERPIVAVSSFLRIRTTFSAAVNIRCWVCWDE